MTTRYEAQTLIAKRLINSALFNIANIATPNRPFDVPPVATLPWCRISFTDGTNERRSIGGDEVCVRFQRRARFVVQIFSKQGLGSKSIADLAEAVADLYEKQSGDRPVSYDAPSVNDIGIDPDGWDQYNVSVPYDFSVAK